MGCEETTWEGEVFGVSQGEKRGEWQRPLTSKLSRIGGYMYGGYMYGGYNFGGYTYGSP